jgi:hypothetical protein
MGYNCALRQQLDRIRKMPKQNVKIRTMIRNKVTGIAEEKVAQLDGSRNNPVMAAAIRKGRAMLYYLRQAANRIRSLMFPPHHDPRELTAPLRYDRRWEPRGERKPTFPGLISQACTQAQMESVECRELAITLDRRALMHRKQWEWCFIVQALLERGMLRPGRRGLGFGVGTEPITAYIAAQGCEIVATDLPEESEEVGYWTNEQQHASQLKDLNDRGLCDPDLFAERVTFRPVDMRAIPDDLRGFDFTWSSCAMEHLGSIEVGLEFFKEQLACLRPGGIGVHTTEYNVSSNDATVDSGPIVVLRRRDIESLVADLRSQGHKIDVTFALGRGKHDRRVELPPFTEPHLKLEVGGFAITSFGLIVEKCEA